MSSFPDLLTAFEEAVEAIKVKLSQDTSANTNYNGESIQSIAKDIDDKWAAIQALVDSALVFETKALMDTHTPTADANGFYPLAKVWRDPTEEYNGLYGWADSAWEKSSYDTSVLVNELNKKTLLAIAKAGLGHTESDSDVELAIIDRFAQLAFAITSSGSVDYAGLNFSSPSAEGDLVFINKLSQLLFKISSEGGVGFANVDFKAENGGESLVIVDKRGNVALKILADGRVEIPELIKDDAPNQSVDSVRVNRMLTPSHLDLPPFADFTQLAMYGQSLSIGVEAEPALSTAPSQQHYMFGYGSFATNLTDMEAYHPIVPYQEGNQDRETPQAGILEMITDLVQRENGIAPPTFLMGGCGQGSKTIEELSKGTVHFNRLSTMLSQGEDVAKLDEVGVSLGGVFWVQGENNASRSPDTKDYADKLVQLRHDIQSQRDSQSADLPLITYQTAPRLTLLENQYGVPDGQMLATELDPLIFLATPTYHLQFAEDMIHLSNVGSKLLGAYMGKAWKRVMIDKVKWRPLSPISISRSGRIISIKLHVPNPPIVIEPDEVHAGFRVNDGDDVPVTSVSVTGDTIRIELSRNAARATIVYGENHIGCVRDTATEHEYVTISGQRYDLHNYLIAFKAEV
ncbi:sialate O-acetylesterase [Vibrio alginolyticus]